MPNMFEKPIAANPMSQFVALPLDYLDKSLQRKQAAYDENKNITAAVEDELLKTNALTGDVARQQAILGEYDTKINDIVEQAGGDYSRISGQLDSLKRDMSKELAYGELGSINKSYNKAMAQKADLDKRYADKKIGAAGLGLAEQAMGKYQTTQGENGQWSTYGGYSPSNIVDPVAELQKSVKEIHAKYDEEGVEYVDNATIQDNVLNKAISNPEIMKSLGENFKYSNPGKTDKDFEEYVNQVVGRIVQDRAYKKDTAKNIDKRTNMLMPGTTYQDFQQPETIQGKSAMVGANAAPVRAFGEWLGADSLTEDFNTFINSEEGVRSIDYMEKKTGTKMPSDYLGRVNWYEDNASAAQKSSIVTKPIDPNVAKYAMTPNGAFNYTTAIRGRNGKILSAEQRKELEGKSADGNATRITGVVDAGGEYVSGSYTILGKDGEVYVQEPGDPITLGSQKFNLEQINSAASTNTGRKNIKVMGDITDTKTGEVQIPRGDYEAVHDINDGDIDLYRNGTKLYTKRADGFIEIHD